MRGSVSTPNFGLKNGQKPPNLKMGEKPLVENENGAIFGKCRFVYV
jgi:hypothetical protein